MEDIRLNAPLRPLENQRSARLVPEGYAHLPGLEGGWKGYGKWGGFIAYLFGVAVKGIYIDPADATQKKQVWYLNRKSLAKHYTEEQAALFSDCSKRLLNLFKKNASPKNASQEEKPSLAQEIALIERLPQNEMAPRMEKIVQQLEGEISKAHQSYQVSRDISGLDRAIQAFHLLERGRKLLMEKKELAWIDKLKLNEIIAKSSPLIDDMNHEAKRLTAWDIKKLASFFKRPENDIFIREDGSGYLQGDHSQLASLAEIGSDYIGFGVLRQQFLKDPLTNEMGMCDVLYLIKDKTLKGESPLFPHAIEKSKDSFERWGYERYRIMTSKSRIDLWGATPQKAKESDCIAFFYKRLEKGDLAIDS